jgi:hypothetical protein
MTAVAGNFGDILFFRRLALRAAVFLVIPDHANTRFVPAFIVFVCHKKILPCPLIKYLSLAATGLIIDRPPASGNKKSKADESKKKRHEFGFVPFLFTCDSEFIY